MNQKEGSSARANRRRRHSASGYTHRGYGHLPLRGKPRSTYVYLPLPYLDRFMDAGLSRQALVLAMLLQRQADLRSWPVVKLPVALLNRYRFSRNGVSLALRQLEAAGLVRVHRKPGRRSTVTLLWHSPHAEKLADMREKGEA